MKVGGDCGESGEDGGGRREGRAEWAEGRTRSGGSSG